ncbi:MAG: DedA family protein [Rubrivivax sp.]|nr:DedA family protein [Rubrivivax sp.]
MTLDTLIVTHGYWLLVAGCLLEGETILLLAGVAAHRGHLDPVAVVSLAAAAGFAGDEFFFWLGRRRGARLLAHWPSLAQRAPLVQGLIGRHAGLVIVGVRFAYGLRIAGPVLIGMSPVSAVRFALFNAVGALLWAVLVGGAGWLFGRAAEALLGDLRHLESWLFLGVLATALAIWSIRRLRAR